jgi:uncharacterized sodium:solute symporter family permease YidK
MLNIIYNVFLKLVCTRIQIRKIDVTAQEKNAVILECDKNLSICLSIYAYICVYTCMHTYIRAHTHGYVCVHVHVYTYYIC